MHARVDTIAPLADLLPDAYALRLEELNHKDDLLEIILDLGRPPLARYREHETEITNIPVSADTLLAMVEHLSFSTDNRAGIDGTLHRISALRNRRGDVVGLSCRIGRSVPDACAIIEDLARSGKSLLVVGGPGTGKTTVLRDLARVLAQDSRRVVVVDTSNEIGGDGDVPHEAIGSARRMQVPTPSQQHEMMIQAVENHMPQVIVIDEIGTREETAAARTIAERGVQLVATAHGRNLSSVLLNPTLADLVGGIEAVTLGDDEAHRRQTNKTVLERRSLPTFDVCIEIESWNSVVVYTDVARAVDSLLAGERASAMRRSRSVHGATTSAHIMTAPLGEASAITQEAASKKTPKGDVALFALDVPVRKLADIMPNVPGIHLVHTLREADVVLAPANVHRRARSLLQQASEANLPLVTIRRENVRDLIAGVKQARDVGNKKERRVA